VVVNEASPRSPVLRDDVSNPSSREKGDPLKNR
jgi:hypothetical protein